LEGQDIAKTTQTLQCFERSDGFDFAPKHDSDIASFIQIFLEIKRLENRSKV
jgi:hypothetical protein